MGGERTRIAGLVALGLLVSVAGLTGCDRLPGRRDERATETAVAAATAAATARPRPAASRDVVRAVSADGRLARDLAPQPLSFKSAGTLVAMLVTVGQTVTPGQPLARIDTLSLDMAVADARAAVLQAESAVAKLAGGAQVETARLQLEQAKNQLWGAQAQRDSVCGAYERWKGLPDEVQERTSGVDQAACDGAQASVQSLEQGVALAEAALRQAEQSAPGDLVAARAGLDSARLALRRTQESRAGATLTAPLTGTIAAVHLVAGLDVAPGVPVVTLDPAGTLQFVTTNLGERDIGDVAEGATASVTLYAFPDEPLPAIVRRIASEAIEDPTGGVVFAVTLAVDPGDLPARAGMTGRVEIDVGDAVASADRSPGRDPAPAAGIGAGTTAESVQDATDVPGTPGATTRTARGRYERF